MALIATKATKNRKPPILPKEALEKLKCIECNSYLSVPPILKHPTLGSICGYCAPYNTDENFIRNTEYEIVASFIDFPCKNFGCHKRLFFGQIGQHEFSCIFRKYDCPSKDCTWSGCSYELKSHYSEKHLEFLIENQTFKLNLLKNCIQNLLLVTEMDTYLVQYQCIVKSCKFWCLVRYVGQPGSLCKYRLEITGNKSDKVFVSREKAVQSDICLLMDRTVALEINISEMLRFLNCPGQVSCFVRLIKL